MHYILADYADNFLFEPYRVYRGLVWVRSQLRPSDIHVVARAARPRDTYAWVQVACLPAPSFKMAFESALIFVERAALHEEGQAASLDGCPWEIHMINDETAYREAYRAWQYAQR